MTLNQLRGRHPDVPAFVLGSGPSLRLLDLEAVHGRAVLFTVNSAIIACRMPDYHVVTDFATPFLKSFPLACNGLTVICVADDPRDAAGDALEGLSWILGSCHTHRNVLRFPYGPGGVSLKRSSPAVSQIACSSIAALHLAIIAGCNPIFLAGMDCTYADGKKYFYEFGGYLWPDGSSIGDDPFVEKFRETECFIKSQRHGRNVLGEGKQLPKDASDEPMFRFLESGWKACKRIIDPSAIVLNASGEVLSKFFESISLEQAYRSLPRNRLQLESPSLKENCMKTIADVTKKYGKLQGECLEVGVGNGDSAVLTTQILQPKRFVLVDAYKKQPWEVYPDAYNVEQPAQDKRMASTLERVMAAAEKTGTEIEFCREMSLEYAEKHQEAFDFIYLDANHSQKTVEADLAALWPHLRPGGVMFCHDYCRLMAYFGVIEAVNGFVATHDDATLAEVSEDVWPVAVITKACP